MYERGKHPNLERGWCPPNSPWRRPGVLARLEELFEDGLTDSTTARLLNAEFNLTLTKNAVVSRRHRKGMLRNDLGPWPIPTDRNGHRGGLWVRLEAHHDELDQLLLEVGRKRRAGALYVQMSATTSA